MKKTLLIIITVFITACGSTKMKTDRIIDEKFKLCSDIKYDRLITVFYPDEEKRLITENIHSLFENSLLKQGHLTDISKAGYSNLLGKIKRGEVGEESTKKFSQELSFNPVSLFPDSYFTSCYAELIEELELVNEQSWQYQFRDAYWKFEAEGDLNSDNVNQVEKALQLIPAEKFKEIAYRKLFLDLIYMHLR
ncbi:hypothetical protein [Salinimicrobium oceani]|uniref:Lipoprotein n=1 Tax=Salinimicrobium oceani TaxID=2722702 RepID=A0ABX1D045_9FLAO|nr:hypothetical protein [Salinimicrobium oceani]NJW53640.1 hypothetical protein [Salinimicrobium oceani]